MIKNIYECYMTKILKIRDIIGSEYAVSTEHGEQILSRIKELLNQNENIEISFDGVDIIISAFLNRILGDLYADYPAEIIEKMITFKDTNKNIDDLIILVKRTAKEFYNKKNDNI